MYSYIPYEERARILSLDPGTTCTGLAIVDYGVDSGLTNVPFAKTYKRSDLLRELSWKAEMCGERSSVVVEYGKVLRTMLEEWQPTVVVAEAPFLKRMPVPFKALSELMIIFTGVVNDWDPRIPLIQVPPIKPKAMMGIAGKGSQKETMRSAVMSGVDWTLPSNVAELDEHSIDAISVGLWGVKEVYKSNR